MFGGGEDWGQGDGLPRPHATSWKGDRQSWKGKSEGGGDEGWGEGGTMPPCYMDLERLNLYIDYEAFQQWHYAL